MNFDVIKREIDNFISSGKLEEYNRIIKNSGLILLLGNGGSNAIASHIAQDYTKVLKKNAFAFSDASKLTCYSNDYGYINAYKQFIVDYSRIGNPLVILISSSGESNNIIICGDYCQENNIPFITLSGFNKDNQLNTRYKSLLSVHVNSKNYGEVECLHEMFLHSVC